MTRLPLGTHVCRLLWVPALCACVTGAEAQRPRGARDSVSRDTADLAASTMASPGSPREALRRYLELAREGSFDQAARYLDVPDSLLSVRPALARELELVLDRHLWLDLDDVSGAAAGDTTDGLSAGVDQIGAIRRTDGSREPVRLTRVAGASDTSDDVVAWRFSRGTVERVPGWYADLGNRWLLDRLPVMFLRAGPLDLLWWQWMTLPALLAISILIGALVARVLRGTMRRLTRRTMSQLDDIALERLAGPLTASCAIAAAALLLPALALYAPAAAAAHRTLRGAFLVVFFWAVWRLVDVGQQFASGTRWARCSPASRNLIPLGARSGKVVIGAVACVAILSLLGYPVASLVAGLGIGGLALALAAQKTVENLFGAFSIGVDQPFREGDFVHVDDFVGTVEAIGLRSTRFRTLDRTLVTLPNGRLADMRLESFTARDRLRLATTLGLVYETTPSQMRDVLAGCERVLRDHPKIWPDAVVVRFSELAASSLNVDVMAWFQTSDWGEFQAIRQDILLAFMEVVEAAGTSFAFPTSTVHLATDGGMAAAPGHPAPGWK
ncbi:MAG TPA: mechanosensitive ion channel family protein [Gemmatimonadaceae bacterium]